jgi:hypothetical protein
MGRLRGENILLNCCKWLQINGTLFQVIIVLCEGKFSGGQPTPSSLGEQTAWLPAVPMIHEAFPALDVST